MDGLKDKVVFITGASTGIGAGCAKAFGALGARVIVHYNSSRDAADVVAHAVEQAGGKALAVQGDLRRTRECERVIAAGEEPFGRIDVTFNNVGELIQPTPLRQTTPPFHDELPSLTDRMLKRWT